MLTSRKKEKLETVYISCCSRRQPEWGMILRLQQAMQCAAKCGINCVFVPRVGESLICRARQNTLYDFYQRGFEWLLSVDDDVELCEHHIVRLVRHNLDIVGGFYRIKREDKAHTAVRIHPPVDGKPDFKDFLKKELVAPVIYVSTGVMLVRREVVTKMIEHYPEQHYYANRTTDIYWALYQPFIHNMEYLSEDWAFCQRARDAGFQIYADGGVRCPHWGITKYDFEEPEEQCHSPEQSQESSAAAVI